MLRNGSNSSLYSSASTQLAIPSSSSQFFSVEEELKLQEHSQYDSPSDSQPAPAPPTTSHILSSLKRCCPRPSRGPLQLAFLIYCLWMLLTNRSKLSGRKFGSDWVLRLLTAAVKTSGFRHQLHLEESLDVSQRYMFAIHPHGVLALSALLFMAPQAQLHSRLRQLLIRPVAASVVFYVPLLRELMMVTGARDASKACVKQLIKSGHSVALFPGGIWEQVSSDNTQEQAFVQRGLGFIRMAIQHGLPIVPVYQFGENQLFKTTPLLLPLRLWVAKHLRIGLPLTKSPLLQHQEVTHVFGQQVDVGPPDPEPSQERVERVYTKYSEELHRLFDKHKDEFLPPDVASKGLLLHRL